MGKVMRIVWRIVWLGAVLLMAALVDSESLRGQGCGFLFDEQGTFLCQVDAPEAAGYVFMLREGQRPLVARLADPVHDPETIGAETRVVRASKEYILSCLKRSRAYRWNHHGAILGTLFMWKESGYGGTLDFAVNSLYDITDNILYITESHRDGAIAHNRFNFGNFLWGAAAQATGLPCFFAKLGSHVNAFLFPQDGRGRRGQFDTPDDILSINAGYAWSR